MQSFYFEIPNDRTDLLDLAKFISEKVKNLQNEKIAKKRDVCNQKEATRRLEKLHKMFEKGISKEFVLDAHELEKQRLKRYAK